MIWKVMHNVWSEVQVNDIFNGWEEAEKGSICKKLMNMSLDAGLRMDGLLALDLWDVVIEVLRSSKSTKNTNSSSSRKLFAESHQT